MSGAPPPTAASVPEPRAAASAAVLLRELVRSSRRWQLYGLRIGFSGALLGMVLAVLWRVADRELDLAAASKTGRELFHMYVVLQYGFVTLLAPLLVALGIVEERDEKTLDLLALTRLTTVQILTGKIVARLAALLAVIAGGLPVLALVLSLGGVSPWEVVNATANAALVAVVLGVLGGFTSLFARGGVMALFAAGNYAILAFFVLPVLHLALSPWEEEALLSSSPYFAAAADGAWGLLPLLAYAPVVLWVAAVSGPVFRMVTSTDAEDGDGELSPEIWAIERFRARVAVVTLGSIPLFGLVLVSRIRVFGVPEWAQASLAWAWFAVALLAGTGLYLLAVMLVSNTVATWTRRRVIAREVDEPTRERPLRWLAALGRTRVWGNPVAWREVMTRAQGPTRLLNRVLLLGWAGLLCFLLLCAGLDEEVFVGMGIIAVLGAGLLTMLAATASMAEERRARTLPLLLATTLSPLRVVTGKLLAVIWQSGPLFVVGYLCVMVPVFAHSFDRAAEMATWAEDLSSWCDGAPRERGLGLDKQALTAAWAAGVWLTYAVACLWIGLRARPAALAWALNLGLAFAWMFAPVFLEEVVGRSFRPVRELWLPITAGGWEYAFCGSGPELVVGTLIVWTAGVVAFVGLVRGLPRGMGDE